MIFTLLNSGAALVAQTLLNGTTIKIDGFQLGSGTIIDLDMDHPVDPVYISDYLSQIKIEFGYDPNSLRVLCTIPALEDDTFDIGQIIVYAGTVPLAVGVYVPPIFKSTSKLTLVGNLTYPNIASIFDLTDVVDYRKTMPNSFNDVDAWANLAISASEIFTRNVVSPRNQLLRIRNPQGLERPYMVDTARMLGLNFFKDKLKDSDFDRIGRYIAKYYPEKGTPTFGNLLSFIKNTRIDIAQLWTRDFSRFLHLEDLTTHHYRTIYDDPSGPFYPTSHVSLAYDAEKFPVDNEHDLEELFYKIAPIHLVLKYIEGSFYLKPIPFYIIGLGILDEERIVAQGVEPLQTGIVINAGILDESSYTDHGAEVLESTLAFTPTTIDESLYFDHASEPDPSPIITLVGACIDDDIWFDKASEISEAPATLNVASFTFTEHVDSTPSKSINLVGFLLTETSNRNPFDIWTSFVRSSQAWYYDDFYTLVPAVVSQPRLAYTLTNDGTLFTGVVLEQAGSNLIPDPLTSGTKTVNLAKGTYTLSCLGTGYVDLYVATEQRIFAGNSATFTLTSPALLVVKQSAGIYFVQLERGTFASSPMLAGSRSPDLLTINTSYTLQHESGFIVGKVFSTYSPTDGTSTVFTTGSSEINCLTLYRDNTTNQARFRIEYWGTDTYDFPLGLWQPSTFATFEVRWTKSVTLGQTYFSLDVTFNGVNSHRNCIYFPDYFDKCLVGRFWHDTKFLNGCVKQLSLLQPS